MKKLGATGEFPRGPLNKTDEGALRVAISIESDCVRIDFGKSLDWIGLPKKNAIAFARVIIAHAQRLPDEVLQ